MLSKSWTLVGFVGLSALHCGDSDADDTSGGAADAGPTADAAGADASTTNPGADAGTALPDSGSGDAGFVPEAFGVFLQFEPEGAVCADGSQYKYYVSFSEASEDVVLFFEGGGACWDYASCTESGVRSAANRNGLPDDYVSMLAQFGFLTVGADIVYPLMNDDPEVTPTHDWNKVFLPYCTGDVFSGGRIATYEDPVGEDDPLVFHHLGHTNVLTVIEDLRMMLPSIDRMLVSGCSAGGSGAINNYASLRAGLSPQRGYLLSDSGPIFPDQAPTSRSLLLHERVREAWGVDGLIDDLPMPDVIRQDYGAINRVLATSYPEDRLASMLFRMDYNYSLYSYERFYELDEQGEVQVLGDGSGLGGVGLAQSDPESRAAVHRLWWDDIELFRQQYDTEENLGYFMPFYRDTNDSHCVLVPGVEEFTTAEVLALFATSFTTIAWAGSELSTESGMVNGLDYVRSVLEDQGSVPSFFEEEGEGRFLSCAPEPFFDAAMCAAAE